MTRLLMLVALVALFACQRPSHEECDRLCWRFSELQFWAAFESQAKELSSEDRETLRKERQLEWDEVKKQPSNAGRDNCVTACRKGGNQAQVTCVAGAATAAEATACLARD